MAYLCFQGEPLGFEDKDNFYKELKEEQMSNGALGSQWSWAEGSMRAHGSCTTVLQGAGNRKSARGHYAMQHGRAPAVFRNLNFVLTIFRGVPLVGVCDAPQLGFLSHSKPH